MKKKYLYGIAFGIIAVLLATFVFLFVGLGNKCSLSVSAEQGYTVTVKDIDLDDKGKAEVRKGDNLVFAVVLDSNYSDSNLKVMANDTELTGKDGVYRYTVENDTTIKIEGVTENDYLVQGVDMEENTLEEGYVLLRDENKRPIPVLSDISMNSVDRTDIPDLDLTASVLESVNPGWKFRELNAVNLGKYAAAKFYVKHSSYLEAKFSFGEKFYERGASDAWHEFLFQNDEGMMTLYVDGEKIGSCNYLSDIQFCLQDKGSYKFSHIYVIPKDDYQGGMLSVGEGEGYQIDIPAREYALGATLQFHVTIDEGFMKGSNFKVKAGNQVLEARADGSYTFVFNGNTTISVTGVVPKPLDSRYQVVGTPMRKEMEETENYILVQSVADSKTYTHTQAQWGSVGFEELELKQYSNLMFFMKKDDTDPKKWVEILQKADDGTVTPYLQKNDNVWHKIEIKKEGGQMYFYLDGERNDTPIIDTEHLSFVMNEGLELRITSLLGIVDPNYVPPEPDYISTAYEVIGTPMAIEGEEVENYVLVSRTEDAKTYEHTPPGWRGFNMVEMDFAPYKSLLFFVHKEDENAKTYLEVIKGDPNQIPHEADYVATNNNKWYKIELVKNAAGELDVYVNDEKHDVTIANTKDLMITISANATLTYTSLFGIPDPAYVPPEPDYIDEEYVTITSSIATTGEETTNYELVSKTEDAKTYQITPPGWRGLSMTEIDIAPYESLLFFVHKEDVNSKTYLEVLKGDPNQIPHEADYVSTNDNKWYKIELVKNAAGELDVYVNDVKHDVTIASLKDLTITISANATLMYTSVFGKADPNYVPPEPDYIDAEYKTIASSLPVVGEEIDNYELVSKTEDAKTYQFTPSGWRTFGMTNVDMNPYKSILFFVHKDDVDSKTYLELYKGKQHGEHLADYISTNDNKWYKIELVKTETGELDVYVNDVIQDSSIASTQELTFTLSANSTLMYTSVFGKADPNYVEPELKPALEHVDFVVEVESGREPVILQLTDTQIIDATQERNADRLDSASEKYWAPEKMNERLYDSLTETIEATKPDLILLTGDLVYGEFDDDGTMLLSLIEKMESFGIPWAPIFGNHENESAMGVDWQCEQLEKAEHCLFKQRTLTGNGNYTVGIKQDGELKRVFFMMDSNGCNAMHANSLSNGHSTTAVGFGQDQMDWSIGLAEDIREVSPDTKISFAFHIQIMAFKDAYEKYGFTNSDTLNNPINIDKLENKAESDFGYIGRDLKGPWDANNTFFNRMKAVGVDSIFVGHEHCNSASVVYEGIRFQFGQKIGTYDRANFVKEDGSIYGAYLGEDTPLSGGTVMVMAEDGSFEDAYIYLSGDAQDIIDGTSKNEEQMVVISPWAYGYGSMDNTQTYTEGGYEYATLVQGSGKAYKGALMKDVQLSDYQEIRFAVKTNGSYYYEGGRVADNEWSMIAGANTTWREWSFKYEADGSGNMGYRLYRDGKAFGDYFLPEDTNLSDLQMKFSSNTAGILYMTEVRGTLKEGVESALKVVAPSFNTYEGEATDSERPIQFATSSMKVATSWSSTKSPLVDLALNGYSKIIFYARQFEGSGYFESDYLGTMQMKDAWVEFRLVKNADNTWNLYCGGILKTENVTLNNLNEVNATYGDGNYYFSQVFGVETGNVEEPDDAGPTLSGEYVVVTSPWAYNKGTMDNSQTYTEGGYEYATLVPGGHVYYEKIRMKDVDLSIFSEFKFAMKTNGSYWYEAGLAADNDYSMIAGANTTWREFVFKYETDSAGNPGFHMYKDGGATSVWLPADMNLSELQMRFSTNESAVLYMTELRGTVKEGVSAPLQVVADSFNTKTGTEVSSETPNMFATKSTEVVTSHSYTQDGLTDVDLRLYDKILFYARKAGSDDKTGWFESVQLGSFVQGYNWTEFKLEKNADGTWNIWTAGVLKASNQTLTNLSDVTATYGINHYYFSEVFGVGAENVEVPEEPEDESPILSGEYVVVTSPWAYNKGTMDNSQTYTDGGYEYATLVPGGHVYYEKVRMKDVDLSIYSEFRFAMKTNGSYWYEAGLAADNDYSMIAGANTTWREYVFKCEDDGTGVEKFHMYRDGAAKNVWLPADMNLSELQMRFSTNESAVLYMTELRGTVKEGTRLPMKVVAESFNTETGTEATSEKPNLAATKSTEVTTKWKSTQSGLTSADLSSYDKILFYARKAGSDDKTGWFESVQFGSFVQGYNWTEFKLEKNADGTWNVWTGGVLKASNQTLTNLSDLTATYGDNHYYFSEVFGIEAQ